MAGTHIQPPREGSCLQLGSGETGSPVSEGHGTALGSKGRNSPTLKSELGDTVLSFLSSGLEREVAPPGDQEADIFPWEPV